MHDTSFSNSVSELPFFDHCVVPFAPSKPGVYLRRAMLEESKKTAGQQVKLCQVNGHAPPFFIMCSILAKACESCDILAIHTVVHNQLQLCKHMFSEAAQVHIRVKRLFNGSKVSVGMPSMDRVDGVLPPSRIIPTVFTTLVIVNKLPCLLAGLV
jgi:hypothetical protein